MPDDPHDLNRFVKAQAGDFDQALSEIRKGSKRSHWMWYIFPQFDGLGFSSTSKRYAIKNLAEAEAYLRAPRPGVSAVGVCRGGNWRRGKNRNPGFRLPGRHEAPVLRHALRPRLARGFGVPPAARPVF